MPIMPPRAPFAELSPKFCSGVDVTLLGPFPLVTGGDTVDMLHCC